MEPRLARPMKAGRDCRGWKESSHVNEIPEVADRVDSGDHVGS